LKLLVLSRSDVERMLSMQKCIELMEGALASLARGEVMLPLRPVLKIPESQNVFALMPAYSRSLNAIGTKLISVYPGNHGTPLDSHQGVVMLFDAGTGSPCALMDAVSITAIRTAAVSAVATKVLARTDARVLAILGSGTQARTHLDAMLCARPFKSVRVWSRDTSHARAFAQEAARRHVVDVSVSESAEVAVRGADVVCTVTAARQPVLLGEWLSAGAHVNAVGASLATTRELDTEAVKRSRVFVDRRESALNEAGDLIIPIQERAITENHIVAELGELLAGNAHVRRDARDVTLFKSLGLAIEDLACAVYLHEQARREGAGAWAEL
jgi:ornithine cyclodeaminase/alanine dehydrogenase-like protein (mu-crystallin family)